MRFNMERKSKLEGRSTEEETIVLSIRLVRPRTKSVAQARVKAFGTEASAPEPALEPRTAGSPNDSLD